MSEQIDNKDDAAYEGEERRSDDSRRHRPDPRKGIRFDTSGGDRRSGFARRQDDEGLRDSDFED